MKVLVLVEGRDDEIRDKIMYNLDQIFNSFGISIRNLPRWFIHSDDSDSVDYFMNFRKFYSFTSQEMNSLVKNGSIPTSFLDDLQERLSELSIGGLFFNFSGWGQSTPSSGDASNTVMVCFTTFPSIAEEMSRRR